MIGLATYGSCRTCCSVSPPFIPALALSPKPYRLLSYLRAYLRRTAKGPPAPAEEDPLGLLLGKAPGNAVEAAIMAGQGWGSFLKRGVSLREQLADFESTLIARALQASGGNVSQAARLLKVQRTTLIEKINKYELRS